MRKRGRLCKRKHDDGTGRSWRYKKGGDCIECHRLSVQAYRQTAKYRAVAQEERAAQRDNLVYRARTRDRNLRRVYGITLADYERMLAEQGGHCAICTATVADARATALHVDHDHTTGRVRGLLCTNCNKGLGHLGDDPVRLHRAVEYLARARDAMYT